MQFPTSLIPLAPTSYDAFFAYLGDQLKDNGQGGTPLFQPMPRAQSTLAPERAAAFRLALDTPLGQPGWRRAWIAVGADGIRGHIDLRARPEPHAQHRSMLGMGVHRDWRGKGLGRRLVALAVQWAHAQDGLDWIDLEVLSVNTPARQLYLATGFVQTGEHADMFRIDGEPHGYTYMSHALRR
ncbi:GNAT family N-acetyltransferase [Rugamonas apoptosis]|uniref:GNAT family N-acetyltransferase n=1 Tax=Rugamonas apoptosis TaxID=2758570 RepID=A0A7W2IMT2_9BURK|nr:GNAT family N-acetyltransferase [Rugamonas apoptosis]MBA5690018.1 GNAT family N-acetyltransferase [Rugamonas apoptosis]